MGRSTGDLQMTEMVHGLLPVEVRDPILPRWWRTVDRWSMASVYFLFIFGLILALAASPPLATCPPSHPVKGGRGGFLKYLDGSMICFEW